MLKLPTHFTGSYAKIICADWSKISTLILEQTRWTKESVAQGESQDTQSALLSDEQWDDAMNGPYRIFFQPHLKAYADITKLETALMIAKEDYFKETEHSDQKIFPVPEKLLSKTENSTLSELREQLNELTTTHFNEWQTQLGNWLTQCIAELQSAFQKKNIVMSDIESHDLTSNEPLSELNDRYINLSMTLPKLSKSDFNFAAYLTLKLWIIIQSALHRTHQDNLEKEADVLLKSFSPLLKKIDKDEKMLAEKQKNAIHQLISKITF